MATSAAQTFVDGFADGFATLVKTMVTFWVDVPTPQIGGVDSPVAHLQGLMLWTQGFILVLSLLYVAGKMAVTRSGKAAGEATRGMVMMLVVTGAGVAAIDALAVAGDAWSAWIIDQAVDGDLTTRLGVVSGGSATMTELGIGIEFLVALLGILSCIAQIFFLLARVGILTLLAGTLPISAAGLSTPAGKAWFQRVLGWIIAFLLYKPAAALVYASAFALTGDGTDLISVLSGLMLIVLAVFALPALMRLVTPMVAAASGGGGGALGGAVAGAAMATGARKISDSNGGSGAPSGARGHLAGAASGAAGRGPSGARLAGAGAGAGAGASGGGAAGGAQAGGARTGGAVGGPVGAAVTAGQAIGRGAQSAAKNSAREGETTP